MNERPFYCEYWIIYPKGSYKFPGAGALHTKTLKKMKQEIKATIKLARESGASEVGFRGIAETRVKHHAYPHSFKLT